MKYEVVIYWSDVDGCFLAEAPDLPGCMADGETYEDALAMMKEVMAIWLDEASRRGEPLPIARHHALSA
jgi:predicted RNase H-like HicB family nuclease